MRRSCRSGFTGCIFADAGKARYGSVATPCLHGSRCRQISRELFGSGRARHPRYSFRPAAKTLRAPAEVPGLPRALAVLPLTEQRARWSGPAREYFPATDGPAEPAELRVRSLQAVCDSVALTAAENDAQELKCPPCARAAEANEFQWCSGGKANLRESGQPRPRSVRPRW